MERSVSYGREKYLIDTKVSLRHQRVDFQPYYILSTTITIVGYKSIVALASGEWRVGIKFCLDRYLSFLQVFVIMSGMEWYGD